MKRKKIFYKVYFAYVLLFFVVMAVVLFKLYGWLRDYEASQPTGKCEEIFAELFQAGDWGRVYDLSGTEDTAFEGRDAYVAYMTKKVGDRALTLSETSAGLSGDKKYFVKLEEEKLLFFTLVSSEDEESGITHWELGDIELLHTAGESVRIYKSADKTVFVNGVELGEEYTVQKNRTLAEEYLPEGVHGALGELQVVSGLLAQPEIKITNAFGVEAEVVYDAERDMYVEQTENFVLDEETREIVLTAAREYSKHMISIPVKLEDYFSPSSKIYKVIRRSDNWVQSYADYDFADEEVTDYYSYTDDLFSARVGLSLNVKRNNGSIKKYEIDSSLFFERQEDGVWRVIEMANVNVQQTVTEVRLTYREDGEVLLTEFAEGDSKKLTTPLVTAPEGKVFGGWMKEETDEAGRTVRVLMFVPDENGVVTLPEDYVLEPMTLEPLYEAADTE